MERMGVQALNVGSLFSGIGGIDLGLERSGMRVVWQCESDPYCQAVLRKHWPGVYCYAAVELIRSGAVKPDLICGGFPCQPVSLAGQRKAQSDTRWLWPEFERVVRLLRPRYVLVENVPGLLTAGMGDVLGGLAALGYDAEWESVSAGEVGAPHIRDRVWIVAYPDADGELQQGRSVREKRGRSGNGSRQAVQDSDVGTVQPRRIWGRAPQADSAEWWAAEPDVGRVAHGVPSRLDRLAALGNAVVPQVAEWIGRRILETEKRMTLTQDAAPAAATQ